ncbi:unnamed protein product [Cylicocyclus nassatus]|uniref:Uncharacterized protein n=1 Tax=Cylicocyclus nassatus TaxID=53992 RepID=A0AA36H7C4_CYLNA|nr:unnamed protein product [Cylicocyclus nassatus]
MDAVSTTGLPHLPELNQRIFHENGLNGEVIGFAAKREEQCGIVLLGGSVEAVLRQTETASNVELMFCYEMDDQAPGYYKADYIVPKKQKNKWQRKVDVELKYYRKLDGRMHPLLRGFEEYIFEALKGEPYCVARAVVEPKGVEEAVEKIMKIFEQKGTLQLAQYNYVMGNECIYKMMYGSICRSEEEDVTSVNEWKRTGLQEFVMDFGKALDTRQRSSQPLTEAESSPRKRPRVSLSVEDVPEESKSFVLVFYLMLCIASLIESSVLNLQMENVSLEEGDIGSFVVQASSSSSLKQFDRPPTDNDEGLVQHIVIEDEDDHEEEKEEEKEKISKLNFKVTAKISEESAEPIMSDVTRATASEIVHAIHDVADTTRYTISDLKRRFEPLDPSLHLEALNETPYTGV